MVADEDLDINDSGEEVIEENHDKLLSAVARIYKKQRVDKPERSEPYLNVSEYHLSNHDGHDKIEVYDLIKTLDKKASHNKIKSKFKSVKSRSVKLPKPLEKHYADKIKRSVGYEHIRTHVSRWDDLVDQNRTASQLTFPLNDESDVKVYKPLEFLHTFKEPTELEKNMAAVLGQSKVAEDDSKVEKAIFKLSVREMIDKRKLIAKLKAKESFKIVKSMKQNKIKSKKYRRLIRKEKTKQELKDFETLQRTDPEAALEKLNKLEKERAEERANLRHRNTGKWARGQAIRAKYDVDARIQLAEQIEKSRELTRKRKITENNDSNEDNEEESNSENDGENEQNNQALVKNDDNNPWMKEDETERQQTVDDFIEGYQNYWKHKKNKPEVKPAINKAALARLIGKNNKNDEKSENKDSDAILSDVNMDNIPESEPPKDSIETLSQPSPLNPQKISNTSLKLVENENVPVSSENIQIKKSKKLNSSSPNIVKHKNASPERYGGDEIKSKINEKDCKKNNRMSVVKKDEQSDDRSQSKEIKAKNVSTNKKRKGIKNVSGSWEIIAEDTVQNKSVQHSGKIDDIFDKMEDTLKEKVQERLRIMDQNVESSDDEGKKSYKKKKFKKAKLNKKINKSKQINESSNNYDGDKDEEIEDILKVIGNDEIGSKLDDNCSTKEPEIDPNKFLNVKPRILNSQVPDMLTEGDAMLDDPEDDRVKKISEAFADDDIVDEFKKEKNEEVKKSENQDIDLFLPGWGSWGGPNIDPAKEKRKRKRFIIKAPQQKRKDSAKPHIIIHNDISAKYKEHMVSDVPYPFSSVKDYEASIRTPIGSTWIPERAVNRLTKPAVVKKMGTIIQPMTDVQLTKKNNKSKLKVTNIGKGSKIK